MSLKNKFFSVITAVFAVAAFGTFASAQDAPAPSKENVERQEKRIHRERGELGRGMRDGKRHGGMRGLMGIELTDAQKEQIRLIHENNKPSETVIKELQAIRQTKRDGGTITAEQKEKVKALRMQAREKGTQVHQQILAVLTAEQRQQLETRKEEMRKKMQERRQIRQPKATTPEKTNDN